MIPGGTIPDKFYDQQNVSAFFHHLGRRNIFTIFLLDD